MVLVIYLVMFLISSLHLTNGDDSCPEKCKCNVTIKAVNCHSAGLTSIPSKYPSYTEIINLSENDITEVNDKAFAGAPNASYIDLRHNKIAKLGGLAFDGVSGLEILYLIDNQLTDDVDWTSIDGLKSLHNLYISFNQFTKIPSLQVNSLRKLVMDGNKITSASFPQSFKNYNNLLTVVLSNNNIKMISSVDFANIPSSVKSLDLKMNSISQIDPAAFERVSDVLETLNLDTNALNSEGVVSALNGFGKSAHPALLTLSLNKNKISKIDADMFKPFSDGHLYNLQLDGNIITSVDPKGFLPIASLQLLSLRHCGLSTINFNLKLFPDLKQLALDQNALTSLPVYLPPGIVRLSASGNLISSWPDSTFQGLNSLNYLDLSLNHLRVFDNPSLNTSLGTALASLQHINVNKNPFNCTCDLQNLVKLLLTKKGKSLFKKWEKYECASPYAMLGKEIVSLDISKCSNKSVSALLERNSNFLQEILKRMTSGQRVIIEVRSNAIQMKDIIYITVLVVVIAAFFFAVNKVCQRRERSYFRWKSEAELPFQNDLSVKISPN